MPPACHRSFKLPISCRLPQNWRGAQQAADAQSHPWALDCRRLANMVTATHQERLGALRSALNSWGYAGAISEGFPIWNPEVHQQPLYADLVAFTHTEQRDISTSAVLAQVVDAIDDIRSRWVPAAAALGAPAVLAALPDRLTLWQTATDARQASELTTAPISAPNALADRMSGLTQETVARAKAQGFVPALFPLGIDVLNNSRRQARTYLTEQVETSIAQLATAFEDARADLIAKLVIGALAILMIRDKASGQELVDARPGALIDIAQQRYPGYFQWLNDLNANDWSSFTNLVVNLGASINFASLEPAMVSDVYEQALVNKFARRERGTFYTPPQLARQMLDVIPLEHLEPSRRTVLDPACGSGTMLLAAANRLSQLQSHQSSSAAVHQYLISHLRGYDEDPLATEITKLCLLMSAMPVGNSWQIDTRDTLSYAVNFAEKPSIIVSNPPWRFNREGRNPDERANVFLSWMLENLADQGFLACVMPLSWINKNNSLRSRTDVLRDADLLEIWRLPSSIFQSTASTNAPAVLVLEKHGRSQYRPHTTLVKTIRSASVRRFLTEGRAEEAYLTEPRSDGSGLTRGLLTRELAGRHGFTTMGTVTEVHIGRPQRSGRPVRTPQDATHYELGSLRKLTPFGCTPIDRLKLVRYPDDYSRSRATDEIVRARKVVVTGKNFSTNNPWRVAVGYDDYGVSLREMFFAVIPDPDWPTWSDLSDWGRFCCLMAVLGSGLGSCWIDENEPTRNLSIRCLRLFPLPDDPQAIRKLAGAGEAMAHAMSDGNESLIQNRAVDLERVVNETYGLSPTARRSIANRLAGAPGFDGAVRYPLEESPFLYSTNEGHDIPSFGHVLKVGDEGLVVWISGVTDLDGVQIEPPLQIPGWLCRSGVDFTVDGKLDNLTEARFGFHRTDWLSDDELMRPRTRDDRHGAD